MTKYKLNNGTTSIDFASLEAVAQFKAVYPEWANIDPVAYTEEPPVVLPQVPEQVTLWQLRKQLKRQKLIAFKPEIFVVGLGQAVGLTQQQALDFSLFQWVKYAISIMPVDTPEQREAKETADEAIEYANNIRRYSPTVVGIQSLLQLTDEQVDQIFITADQIDA